MPSASLISLKNHHSSSADFQSRFKQGREDNRTNEISSNSGDSVAAKKALEAFRQQAAHQPGESNAQDGFNTDLSDQQGSPNIDMLI